MNKASILIIDDESDYSDTMRFYLAAKGYVVRTAPSGRAGIEELRRERPDILFLDFMMPEMDGVETLKLIRQFDTELPVIMVTAYATDEKIAEAHKLNILAIFPKAEDFSQAAVLTKEALENPDLKVER